MSADRGPWLQPSNAAPLMGLTTREVQNLCADRLIDHRIKNPHVVRVQYLISEQAIERYIAKTTIRAGA